MHAPPRVAGVVHAPHVGAVVHVQRVRAVGLRSGYACGAVARPVPGADAEALRSDYARAAGELPAAAPGADWHAVCCVQRWLHQLPDAGAEDAHSDHAQAAALSLDLRPFGVLLSRVVAAVVAAVHAPPRVAGVVHVQCVALAALSGPAPCVGPALCVGCCVHRHQHRLHGVGAAALRSGYAYGAVELSARLLRVCSHAHHCAHWGVYSLVH